MITVNDNIKYLPYKEESFLDENYITNESIKESIQLMKNKIELIAHGKNVTIIVSGDLYLNRNNEAMNFEIICDDNDLYNTVLKAIN